METSTEIRCTEDTSFLPMQRSLTPAQREHIHDFIMTILDIDDPAKIHVVLDDLCGSQELASFADRWAIAKFLQMGFSYRVAMSKTGASSATVGRIARILLYGKGGLRDACVCREQRAVHARVEQPLFPPSFFRDLTAQANEGAFL